jgi:hypothetical protein
MDTAADELPQTVSVKEYNNLQIDAVKQQLFIVNTIIQKVLTLEKAIEELLK